MCGNWTHDWNCAEKEEYAVLNKIFFKDATPCPDKRNVFICWDCWVSQNKNKKDIMTEVMNFHLEHTTVISHYPMDERRKFVNWDKLWMEFIDNKSICMKLRSVWNEYFDVETQNTIKSRIVKFFKDGKTSYESSRKTSTRVCNLCDVICSTRKKMLKIHYTQSQKTDFSTLLWLMFRKQNNHKVHHILVKH